MRKFFKQNPYSLHLFFDSIRVLYPGEETTNKTLYSDRSSENKHPVFSSNLYNNNNNNSIFIIKFRSLPLDYFFARVFSLFLWLFWFFTGLSYLLDKTKFKTQNKAKKWIWFCPRGVAVPLTNAKVSLTEAKPCFSHKNALFFISRDTLTRPNISFCIICITFFLTNKAKHFATGTLKFSFPYK